MSTCYDEGVCFRPLLQGDLHGALEYIDRFPQCREQLMLESGGTDGHAAAAEKIVCCFQDKLKLERGGLGSLPLPLVRDTSLELFWESERALFTQQDTNQNEVSSP